VDRYNHTVASSATQSGSRSVYAGDAASIYPHDSISQSAPTSEREDDQRAVMAYGEADWYNRDPYAPKPQDDIYGQEAHEDYYGAPRYPPAAANEALGRSLPSASYLDETPLVTKEPPSLHDDRESKVPYEALEVGNADEKKPRPNWLLRALRDPSDVQTRVKNYESGIGIQRRPWVCWVLSGIMVIVFIVELVNNVCYATR
jgi:hypothetical protein